MTEAGDHIEDDEDPIAEGPATGIFARGLWREVRWWLHQASVCFGEPQDIAHDGLTRRLGRQLSAWLFAMEGAVRRLVLAAALALGLSPIAPAPRRPRAQARPRAANPVQAAFRVFARVAGRGRRASGASPAWPQDVERHGVFRRDPLLRLDAPAPTPRRKPVAVRRSAPRVIARRMSRWDPHYRARSDWESDLERRERLARARADATPRPKRPRLSADDRAARAQLYVSAEQARQRQLAAEHRVLPAPGLGRRLQALARLMLDPDRIIARTARRLARAAGLAERLAALPAPEFRFPKSDRRQPQAQGLLASAAEIWPPPAHDSS